VTLNNNNNNDNKIETSFIMCVYIMFKIVISRYLCSESDMMK